MGSGETEAGEGYVAALKHHEKAGELYLFTNTWNSGSPKRPATGPLPSLPLPRQQLWEDSSGGT